MENKYYTPLIKEFHIGFEYEYLVNVILDKGWHKVNAVEFETRILSEHEAYNLLGYQFKHDLYNNKIRIKYLDKSDIESLGFVNQFKEGDYPLLYETTDHILIHYNETNVVVITDRFKTLFRGTIKNKSELKRLLQWINIIPQN